MPLLSHGGVLADGATIMTFVVGHAIRVIGIPVGIWAFLSLKKGEEQGVRVLFLFLCGLAAACVLDLFVCLLEVNDVCNSIELQEFNSCSHDWGKQAMICEATDVNGVHGARRDVDTCQAAETTLRADGKINRADDTAKCVAAGGGGICSYNQNQAPSKPTCCFHEHYAHSFSPCNRDPSERDGVFDTTWCQEFSDLYDVGLGLIWTAVVLGMAYVANSARQQAGATD